MKLHDMNIGNRNIKYNVHCYDEDKKMWVPYDHNGYGYFDEEYINYIIGCAKAKYKQIKVFKVITERVI